MRELLERAVAEPADGAAWRALVDAYGARGEVGRAAACLDALEGAAPGERRPAAAVALRRAAGRCGVDRGRALREGLDAPDRLRVTVVVHGEPGAPDTERTLEALGRQSIGPSACEWRVTRDRNGAVAAARGRYVAHVRAGDLPWPDHLDVLVDHLERTGLPLAWSRAERDRSADATGGTAASCDAADPGAGPVRPRDAARVDPAPTPCVVHRRSALRCTGGFEPSLGSGQEWHLWRRFAERLTVHHLPLVTATRGARRHGLEERFDGLLLRLGAAARARRWHGRARHRLAAGDVRLGTLFLARAWNLGLPVEPFVAGIAAVAGLAPSVAGALAALGADEVEPFVRGAFARIARGAAARRELSRRVHAHALRARYAEACRRG